MRHRTLDDKKQEEKHEHQTALRAERDSYQR
jgi:hypothetical protein